LVSCYQWSNKEKLLIFCGASKKPELYIFLRQKVNSVEVIKTASAMEFIATPTYAESRYVNALLELKQSHNVILVDGSWDAGEVEGWQW
jgi:hypothetical protein